jgi:hypothetical protein
MTFDKDCQVCGHICYEVISKKCKKSEKYDYEVKENILKSYIYYDYRCICLECLHKWLLNGVYKTKL